MQALAGIVLLTFGFFASCSGTSDEGAGAIGSQAVSTPPAIRSVGGTLTGLGPDRELVLALNGEQQLTLSADGPFAFPQGLAEGSAYQVIVAVQPAGQSCSLSGGSGTVGQDPVQVAVSCTDTAYFVGGSLQGLAPGGQVQLALNGAETLTLSADGDFRFQTLVPKGQAYTVTLASQPAGQGCRLQGGSGTATADALDLKVSCLDRPQPTWTPAAIKLFRFTWQAVTGATHYRLLEDPDGASGYAQVGGDLTATSYEHEVFLPERLNARYVVQACDALGCVDSAPLAVSGTLAQAIGYLKASNTGASDHFGARVALSDDGGILAVAASSEDSDPAAGPGDDSLQDSGAVYVFRRTGTGAWAQEAFLKASNAGSFDYFGQSLALSGDGATLAVGAPEEDSAATGVNGNQADDSALGAGAVYVFVRDPATGSWSQQAYVKASNTEGSDRFGRSVALSGDGATLAVGATGERSNATGINGNQTDNSLASAGAVYLFERTGGTWSQVAYVKASNTGANDSFGARVALSGDGLTLAVGATGEASASGGVNGNQSDNSAGYAGAVYVFVKDPGTGAWSQQAYLKHPSPGGLDNFGIALAVSADGNLLAVGSRDDSLDPTNPADDSGTDVGSVTVFVRDPATGTWSQQAYLKPPAPDDQDYFGYALDLDRDGTRLAVGAFAEDGSAVGLGGDPSDNGTSWAGAAYLFVRSGGSWTLLRYVKASNTGTNDAFGDGLALAGDGSALAVGADGEASTATGIGGDQSDDSAASAGAVYLY